MKYSKSYQAIVAIVMIIMSWSSITAYDFVVDGIYYNILNHNEAEVTHYYTYPGRDYKGYVGNVIIPNKVVYDGTTYNITAIGVDAFTLSESMTGVQIPNSVSSIGKEAFQNCINLTNIEIPNSVTYIGDFAFDSCKGLTSIEIPNSVTYIGIGAFNECHYLNNIDISNSIKSIEDELFSNCTRLSSIKIPHGVLRIGTGAFKYCASLTNIEIPISVTDIGQEAFEGCSSLSSIEIPYGLISIEDNVFNWCKNLTSIKIPNSVTSIGDWAFGSCSSLTSIEIPNSVTSIGRGSFEYCSSLTSVDIPNSVTSIGYDAFCSCASLSSIKVPDSIILIRNCAFADCTGLTKVEWNVKFNSNSNLLESIFRGCSNITSFTFGESVEHIPSDICSNLSNLTDIIIGSNVKTIGSNAFKNCTGLTNIEMPNSITSIEFGAFAGCWSLTSIEIPNSVTSIGDYVFARCSSLTSIEIPNSVTSIGDWAFDNCSSLTSIEIPNSVTSIGYNAFSNCTSLTSVVIGNSVTSIGTCVFSDCNSLTSIVVDSGNTKYDSRNDCNAIIKTASNTLIAGCQNTIIPNSVTSIGNEAFYNCSSLTSIEIPNSVTSIGWYAFAYCTNLKEITCLATTPPAMYIDTFSDYSASLFVPEGYISDYQSADYWNNFNITEISLICSSIKLNRTSVTIKTTETIALNAIVFPKYATNKSVIWKSSNETIATVDANGVVTAIAVGEATITATTVDGSNLSATCKVTVIPILATSIEVTPNEVEAKENTEVQLSVNILPEDVTYKLVEWTSSNDAIASVDANGLVKIYKEGNVVITATTTDGTNLSATCNITVLSGIEGVNNENVVVITSGNSIIIKNVPSDKLVSVYSSNGELVKSMKTLGETISVEAPIKGIYIVAIDAKSFKVMVK